MSSTQKSKIKIDIVSDIVCPWCYVGKKRLENAIEQTKDSFEFEITYRPFQLDPTVPEGGADQSAHFIKKFGSEERLDEIFSRVEHAGASVGIDFKFREIPKALNTIGFHQILQVALAEVNQAEVKTALLEAYMVNPIDLTSRENIAKTLSHLGWNLEKVNQTIDNEALRKQVKSDIQMFQEMGVTGVPFFIINDKYGVSGAQPSDVFVNAFNSLKAESQL